MLVAVVVVAMMVKILRGRKVIVPDCIDVCFYLFGKTHSCQNG